MMPNPYKIEIEQSVLDTIDAKVRGYDWHEMPSGGGWAYGTNLDYMKELATYWTSSYDWRVVEKSLNAHPQFTENIVVDDEAIDIHFYHVRTKNASAPTLLLSHGWPGSVFEFLHLVEAFTDPEAHGGNASDAVHVVIPSLPGYGFSGKPSRPISPRRVARYFAALMQTLGSKDYVAQGGDWGSSISGWLAHDDPNCRAAHLNMHGWILPGNGPQSEEEKEFAARFAANFDQMGAYFRLQMTRPQSLSYAMMDSPLGVAAWIVEKFHGWSDISNDDIETVYSKDQLLTNVMIYLVTRSFNTASWLYRGLFEDPGGKTLAAPSPIKKPVGVANFPKDFLGWPPRSQVERAMNIVHWTDMADGGHFAALEKPAEFVADIRKFLRAL